MAWRVRVKWVMKVYRCCERCQAWRSGTGTKMTMAFLPCPTSICKNPGVSVMLSSAHRLFVFIEGDKCSCRHLSLSQVLAPMPLFIVDVRIRWYSVFILPHVQTRTAVDEERSSCPGCWSRARRGRWRCSSRSRTASAATGCWARSC